MAEIQKGNNMKTGDQPAFPADYPGGPTLGMTYRQWLIGMIASGHAANSRMLEIQHTDDEIAGFTISMADAIIARIEGEGK